MMKKAFGVASLVVIAGMISGIPGLAQDFQRSYAIAADGEIRIWTISGNIAIQGYDGAGIEVMGFKTGRDRDRVEIEDNSSANRIDVGVKYPANCNCSANVNFEVRVPRSIAYRFSDIRSVSGDVSLKDVTGQVRAESTSGDVEVNGVSGMVNAGSISGDVIVTIRNIRGKGSMKFSSISGDVVVTAPASLDAEVEMSTLSGSLQTDFPIQVVERRYGPGRSARGRVGSGANTIRITTISGRVSLKKG